MRELAKRLEEWDCQYNDFPRKIILTVLVVLSAFIVLQVLPYTWPFVIGLMFAALMSPLVRLLSGVLKKLKSPEKVATLISMLIVYGTITIVLLILFRQIVIEGEKLINNIPGIIEWVQHTLQGWIDKFTPDILEAEQEIISSRVDEIIATLSETLRGLVSRMTPAVASGAWSTVTGIPHAILFVVMTMMSSFYFASDKEKIGKYLTRMLPAPIVNQGKRLRKSIFSAVFKQMQAQILISLAIMVALVIGFTLFNIEYALILGTVIGFLDVLPIIGAGTFLIPWSLFNLFAGNISLGLRLGVMYLVVVVIRQIIEPRIVGKKLGLYPLISMASMYIGLKLMGFLGLIIGPVLANICKVVLESDAEIRRQQRAASERAPIVGS